MLHHLQNHSIRMQLLKLQFSCNKSPAHIRLHLEHGFDKPQRNLHPRHYLVALCNPGSGRWFIQYISTSYRKIAMIWLIWHMLTMCWHESWPKIKSKTHSLAGCALSSAQGAAVDPQEKRCSTFLASRHSAWRWLRSWPPLAQLPLFSGFHQHTGAYLWYPFSPGFLKQVGGSPGGNVPGLHLGNPKTHKNKQPDVMRMTLKRIPHDRIPPTWSDPMRLRTCDRLRAREGHVTRKQHEGNDLKAWRSWRRVDIAREEIVLTTFFDSGMVR